LLGSVAALAVVGSCTAGYLARSPLPPGRPLTDLVGFEPTVVVRARDAESLWRRFCSLPHFQRVAEDTAGGRFLAATPAARLDALLRRHARFAGVDLVDVFDVTGEDVVLAIPEHDTRTFLILSRLRPAANAALGLYALGQPTRPAPSGRGWMIVDADRGLAWTKLGDVLVVSNAPGLVDVALAAATDERDTAPLAQRIGETGSGIAFALPSTGAVTAAADAVAPAGRLALQIDPGDRPAAEPPTGGHAAFRWQVAYCLPRDTAAGAMWRVAPETAWQMALGALARLRPDAEREDVDRYVEDELLALLGADSFEQDVLARMTGDAAVAVSHTADPWLGLGSGVPVPTVSVIVAIRRDTEFERRLELVWAELRAALQRGKVAVSARLGERPHRGRTLHTLVVRDRDEGRSAEAGYVVEPAPKRPERAFLMISTSAAWLAKALDARDGVELPVAREAWFRRLLRPVGSDKTAFGFCRGDVLAGAIERLRPRPKLGQPTRAMWLRLLGIVSFEGTVRPDGRIDGELYVTGQVVR
jgi:hypothetical protein